MDLTADLEAPCPVAELYPWVADLERYPAWLTIVTRAVASPAGDDGRPAWLVDLTGHLGPFRRSKRLRMVRTVAAPDHLAVFERRELDGRHHAPWVLRAQVDPTAAGSRLVMQLHYGGALWGAVLERLLGDEIDRARPRLVALVSG